MSLNIVLFQPEIPQNTGNIARTCAATGCSLHLIRPLGFKIDDSKLKRAGLDYWDELDLNEYQSFDEVMQRYPDGVFFFCTTKAKHTYSDVRYTDYADKDIFLVFGKETKGLPEELLAEHYESCIRIPMKEHMRSLNLSNSVAIIAYEVLRQFGFEHLKQDGELTKQH